MSLFVDEYGRRKSTLALAAFGAALLDVGIFGLLYVLLAKLLNDAILLRSGITTLVVQALIIAVLGVAVSCLLFLMKDKRIVPCGYLLLGVLLLVFYAAALLLEKDARPLMLYLVTLYGLAPVVVGNVVTWTIYIILKRNNPAMIQRLTMAEELKAAIKEKK